MGFKSRFVQAVCSIGARREVELAAPTQIVAVTEKDGVKSAVENVNTYSVLKKPRMLDRWLDNVTEFSGSQIMFFAILSTLLTWAFLGIPYGDVQDWQVGISDGQAILNLVFDSFLMRQQLNNYRENLVVMCCLRSRTASQKKMLRALANTKNLDKAAYAQLRELNETDFLSELPSENWLGKVSTAVSLFMGHICTVIGFWVGIIIWIGFGQYDGWTSDWLFYCNSATSALMVFMLAFLANIRERHSSYAAKCLDLIYVADAALELKLRAATGDDTPNEMVKIPPPKITRVQRWIDFYADLVGTLLGIVLLFLVLIVWVVIGPVMSFSSNWWLLIGTYAGLIGLNDGFVLRNVYNQIAGYENKEYDQQIFDDMDMLDLAGLPHTAEEQVVSNSLTQRISVKMGDWCSHQWTVILGFFTIIALVVGASAMGWSITGQLLCNVPPSIIESFFTLILITGHNIGDKKRRVEMHNIYLRRLQLISHVDGLFEEEKDIVGEKEVVVTVT